MYSLIQPLRFLCMPARFKGGIASFCFDDAPQSAWLNGSAILAEYGYRATYFIATGMAGTHSPIFSESLMDWQEIHAAHERGHEIASHTSTHCVVSSNSDVQFMQEIIAAKQTLAEHALIMRGQCGFAYPKGVVPHGKAARKVRATYGYARSIIPDVNHWPYNRYCVKAHALYENRNPIANIRRILKTVCYENSWVVFYVHDVKNRCSKFGCTTTYFSEIVRAVHESNVTVKTIAQILLAPQQNSGQ